MITIEEIRSAHQTIAPYVRRTPLLQAAPLKTQPQSLHKSLWLKLENHQVTGSFKARGAVNKLLSVGDAALSRGIVTASGGNHGLAVAYVGYITETPTTVYLPSSTPEEKREKIASWGAEIIIAGSVWDEANEAALTFAEETGAIHFHPFADEMIIAGQGTTALEVFEDNPSIDTVVCAIGGGGLISGVGIAAKAHGARVIGVEPVGAPTLYESRKAGHVIRLDAIRSKVGTLSPLSSAPLNVGIVMDVVDDIVLVTDEEMEQAARWLWFEMGIAADLAGAAATAALLTGRVPTSGHEHICSIVCGSGKDIFL